VTAATGVHVAAGPDPAMVPEPHRVVHRRVEIAADPAAGIDEVVTLGLRSEVGPTPTYRPGQFAMAWAPGVGEVPISASASADGVVGLTIRAVGATTSALCAATPGSTVGLRGPFGRGWTPVEADVPMVVVTGGIGLAPLRLHIEQLVAERAGRSDPGLVLVIGARTPAEVLYPEVIDAWSERCRVHVTVDRGRPGWRGEVGLVTSTLSRLRLAGGSAAALCGPEIMMRLAAADLLEAGADARRVEVSLERAMACAVAHCGRCQVGPVMVCRDGPVLSWTEAAALLGVRRW
jgi:anaerobic sulfite reductase subunit B